MSRLIWIYTVCTSISFGLPDCKGYDETHLFMRKRGIMSFISGEHKSKNEGNKGNFGEQRT